VLKADIKPSTEIDFTDFRQADHRSLKLD